jgi:hypothetical protein
MVRCTTSSASARLRAIPTQIFVLPQPLMDSLTALTGLLGGTQNLGVQIAARYGMAYHPLFPDHVYSPDYFPNLLKLGKRYPGIAQSSISANDTVALRSALLAHGPAVPAADLGTIGLEHLHAQSAGNLMNIGEGCSVSRIPPAHLAGQGPPARPLPAHEPRLHLARAVRSGSHAILQHHRRQPALHLR